MTKLQLKLLADRLWAGETECVRIMGLVGQFTRGVEVLKWFDRNNIRGRHLEDFFHESEGNETRGVLLGVRDVLGRIDRESGKVLTIKELVK